MKPISLEEAALLFDLGVDSYFQDLDDAECGDWWSVFGDCIGPALRPGDSTYDEYLHWAIYDHETDHT